MEPRSGTRSTGEKLSAAFEDAPFTAAQALDEGVSRRRLQSAVRSGVVRHIDRTHYAVGDVDPRDYLLVRQNHWEASGAVSIVGADSAARIWGIPVLGRRGPVASTAPTFWVPEGVRPGIRNGAHAIVGEIPATHIVTLDNGLRITSPLRTAIDVVRQSRLPRHLALATLCGGARVWLAQQHGLTDSAAAEITELAQDERTRDATRRALLGVLMESPRWGSSTVRCALPLVDARLETALESTSWGRFADAGVPMPVPQVWLQGASGCWYRVDFWWEEFAIIGEADGMVKYRSAEDLAREKARQLDLEGLGRRMRRWGWTHAVRDHDPLMAELFGCLREAPRAGGRRDVR